MSFLSSRETILQLARHNATPFYWYDMDLLEQTIAAAVKASKRYNYHVHYALKANSNLPILRKFVEAGLGADCVSGNEILRALEAGFKPNQIAFAGVGKSDEEINIGLENEIFAFNCESIEEIEVIQELAHKYGKKAAIALRINPHVNAHTHHYITTGLEENKFGIDRWQLEEVLEVVSKSPNIVLKGLHFHIGSQITDLDAFKNLCIRVNELQDWFIERKVLFEYINVGGGLGIDYYAPDEHPMVNFDQFFGLFNEFLQLQPHQELHFELGRSLIGSVGSLITKVLYVKKGKKTQFAILDAGMTELIRPALYQAYHKIENLSKGEWESNVFYDVVGPICESSDCFGKKIQLPLTERGDIMAIRCTGAYGEVMANNYNLRPYAKAFYG
jgi:diaminopimelate decarboxylase